MNKKPLLIGLLVFALLATGLSLIFIALTPTRQTSLNQTSFMSTNFDQSISEFKNLEFTGGQPAIPTKLPIAEIKINPTLANQVAQQLIEQYSLKQIPRSENLWVAGNTSLFRDEKRNEYVFTKETTAASTSATLPTDTNGVIAQKTVRTETAVVAADSFVQTILSQGAYQPIRSQLRFFSAHNSTVDLDETNEAEATLIEIPFAPQVASLPIMNSKYEYAPIRVLLNADNELVKLTFQAEIVSATIIKQVDTISIKEAMNNILSGQGAILSAYQATIKPLDLTVIYSGKLTKARVEYRTDLETGLAFPVYHFTGTVLTKNGDETNVDIITPAVRTTKQ